MTNTEHKPSDHILDDFLAKHGVTIEGGWAEFTEVLADLRVAIVEEERGNIRADTLSEAIDTLDNYAATLDPQHQRVDGLEYGGTLLYRLIPRDQQKRLTSRGQS